MVVGLPYSLVFLSVLVVFCFKNVVVLLWSCEEAQCVYLCLHLVRKPELANKFFKFHGGLRTCEIGAAEYLWWELGNPILVTLKYFKK